MEFILITLSLILCAWIAWLERRNQQLIRILAAMLGGEDVRLDNHKGE